MSNNTDTKVLQVLGCQGRQDRVVDLVLAERRSRIVESGSAAWRRPF